METVQLFNYVYTALSAIGVLCLLMTAMKGTK